MNFTEYAAHLGVTKGRVSHLKKSGRLVLQADGSVDVEASDAALGRTMDPQRRQAAGKAPKPPPAAAEDDPAPLGSTGNALDDLTRYRAAKERELSLKHRLEREELEGLLVRADQVRSAVRALAGIVTTGLANIAPRVMPLINSEADPAKRETILDDAHRQVMVEFAAAAERMANG